MLQLMKYSEMKMGLIQNCCIKNYLSRDGRSMNSTCLKFSGTVIFLLLHFQVTRFSTKMYLRQQPAIFFTTEMGISFLQRLEDWAKLTSRTTWSLLPAYSVYWASKVFQINKYHQSSTNIILASFSILCTLIDTLSLTGSLSVYQPYPCKVVGSCEKRQLDQCTGADTAGKISHCWKQCLNSFSFLDSLC
ncbi:hypothetical protein C5167_018330 [Papaver somniferum]|uniref:Uncharacterized protein n=1 Tax=Papaver somniferum TaxID=3469 RepID=A0A4Y7IQD1_PAPSO|nr:hypothetical protein C5167_018330 [Papaver somniferum]